MYPVLLTIGTWKLRANLVFFILSAIIGVLLGMREASKIKGLPSNSKAHLITSFGLGITLSYFIGRLNGGLYTVISQGWNWKALPNGGMISFGVILGGLLYVFLVSKIFKFSTARTMDVVALILPLSESIYRVGCILNGCCYGRETDGFGGFYLPEVHGVWARRYPTQIMLLIFNALLFMWLWRRSRKFPKPGSQTILFLLAYTAGRFVIDYFRGDMPMAGALGYHQITSLIIFFATLVIYLGTKNPLSKLAQTPNNKLE